MGLMGENDERRAMLVHEAKACLGSLDDEDHSLVFQAFDEQTTEIEELTKANETLRLEAIGRNTEAAFLRAQTQHAIEVLGGNFKPPEIDDIRKVRGLEPLSTDKSEENRQAWDSIKRINDLTAKLKGEEKEIKQLQHVIDDAISLARKWKNPTLGKSPEDEDRTRAILGDLLAILEEK